MSAKERDGSPVPTQCDGSGPVRTPQVTSASGDWQMARLPKHPNESQNVSFAAQRLNEIARRLGPTTGAVLVFFTPRGDVRVVQSGQSFEVEIDLALHNISQEAADAALTAALARIRGEL